MNPLVEFWSELNVDQPPFIHPQDLALFGDHKEFVDKRTMDHRAFIESDRFPGSDGFHLSLLPVPYVGNLDRAKVFILLLNPGFNISNYQTMQDANYRSLSIGNLRQSLQDADYPFISLHPDLATSAGFQYWHKKFGKLIQLIARQKQYSYLDALRELCRTIAAIELVPYRSEQFGANRLIATLPSAIAAKKFVQEDLVARVKKNEATIIVTRKADVWDIPEELAVIYRGGQTRGAHLGPDTLGGKAILRRMGLIEGQ